ncbi:MAG TPA: hypothetical protein VGD62_00915 [Acidobacteriaceae bacterium]
MTRPQLLGLPRRSVAYTLLCALATIHVVGFYLSRVPCYLRLPAYEQGLERTPFQYRLLLMVPLRWAHSSPSLIRLAAFMSSMPAWFPRGVRPEGILQGTIDLASVATAGLVARALYRRTSRTQLLTPYLYPLTLLMVASTYAVLTLHAVRFPFDLPSLAFFSLGLYLIHAQRPLLWFSSLFLVATINRETTLLLLVFFVLAECSRNPAPHHRFDWRRSYAPPTLRVVLPLATAWLAWHLWVVHRFAANPPVPSAMARVALNLGTLAIPLAWPQLLATFGYLLPAVLAGRRSIHDAVLRSWLWALPVWLAFMLYYEIVIEIRLFGELIPYIACIAALIAEQALSKPAGPAHFSGEPTAVATRG